MNCARIKTNEDFERILIQLELVLYILRVFLLPYFPAQKTHFFPRKRYLNSTCVLCTEGIIFKLINTRTRIE